MKLGWWSKRLCFDWYEERFIGFTPDLGYRYSRIRYPIEYESELTETIVKMRYNVENNMLIEYYFWHGQGD